MDEETVKLVYFIAVTGLVTLILLSVLAAIRRALIKQGWRIAEAMSEELDAASLPAAMANPAPQATPTATDTYQLPGHLIPSASRLIGMVGLVIMAAMYVGIGYFALYAAFFSPASLAYIDDLAKYFLVGSALFAPYAFNQLSSMMK
ncbi:hypothetical protein QWZ03_17105 [Chitinimonas viridis]|uniref:Uncharacterized protein n=1 Tax=Chitinimonas viridis TaxID=664880 RepID=A0ABT8BA69_9NEIS|nr:hypothetical protein [Chitinimonas viridis]MDN3578491.1 hypothetical protein [Chitinimonas viridis]